MHVEIAEFDWVDEPKFDGFIGDGQIPADDPSPEAHVELPSNLSIAVGDDVTGIV